VHLAQGREFESQGQWLWDPFCVSVAAAIGDLITTTTGNAWLNRTLTISSVDDAILCKTERINVKLKPQ